VGEDGEVVADVDSADLFSAEQDAAKDDEGVGVGELAVVAARWWRDDHEGCAGAEVHGEEMAAAVEDAGFGDAGVEADGAENFGGGCFVAEGEGAGAVGADDLGEGLDVLDFFRAEAEVVVGDEPDGGEEEREADRGDDDPSEPGRDGMEVAAAHWVDLKPLRDWAACGETGRLRNEVER